MACRHECRGSELERNTTLKSACGVWNLKIRRMLFD